MYNLRHLLLFGFSCAVLMLHAQQDDSFYELSLEDLLNMEIVAASKKAESIFDAPLASYVISREEIKNSGVNSIPEALRLCPGMIVRETTNGNYDIHIRGFDNLIRYSSTDEQFNQYTLVMVNNRPVFNYGRGGTFWEIIPVDLIDIDRIEIVQGPAAPLYGPNTVTGVINIITKTDFSSEDQSLYVSGNLAAGDLNTSIGNVAVGYSFNDKLNAGISTNFQNRDRHSNLYYELEHDFFTDNPDTLTIQGTVPGVLDESLALERFGINAYINASISNDFDINFAIGHQDASAQRPGGFARGSLQASTSEMISSYVNLRGKYKGFNFRLSSQRGTDDLEATDSIATGFTSGKYDYSIRSIDLFQDINLISGLRITPGVNFQSIKFDDTPYIYDNGATTGLYNKENTLNIFGGSLRLDYNLFNRLRLIGAARIDKYNVPDTAYLAYQFASTYKATENLIFRASFSKSNVSAFMTNSFQNTTLENDFGSVILRGNENLELTTNRSIELGTRFQIANKVQFDASYFNQRIRNLYSRDAVFSETGFLIVLQNRPIVATQDGFTFNVNYLVNEKIQLKPFVTWQVTNAENVGEDPEALFNAVHKATPSVYGGLFANYTPIPRLNVNVNTYYFGNHRGYHRFDEAEERAIGYIQSKFMLNTKVSYEVANKLDIYGNVRNLFGNDSREFLGNDPISGLYTIGISYNW